MDKISGTIDTWLYLFKSINSGNLTLWTNNANDWVAHIIIYIYFYNITFV